MCVIAWKTWDCEARGVMGRRGERRIGGKRGKEGESRGANLE
jgi:hypothetical protein